MSDEYEKKYMGADDALFFERQVARHLLALPALGMGAAIAGAVTAAVGGADVGTALMAGALGVGGVGLYMGTLAVFFGVARTVVTKDELRVEIGMLGPRIPVSQITKAEVTAFTRRRRWGERAYVPPASTEMVRVTYLEKGKERSVLIGTQRATALADAIERAKGGASSMARVRVEAPSEAPVDPDLAAAEAEVEAELARANTKSEARSLEE
ncbi:MAG: hypothetical protein J0L92_31550 [Deltaproteobacteria bacterium]|nr:hypothetical protein [Deltaproteobacteria bacterium]